MQCVTDELTDIQCAAVEELIENLEEQEMRLDNVRLEEGNIVVQVIDDVVDHCVVSRDGKVKQFNRQ